MTEGITAPPVHGPIDTSFFRVFDEFPVHIKNLLFFFTKNRIYFPVGGNRQRGRRLGGTSAPFHFFNRWPFRFVAFLSCRGPVGTNAISLAFLRGEAMGALLGHGFVFHGSGQGVVHVEFPARRGDTCMHACRYTKKTTKKRDKKRDTAGREGVGSSGKQSTA